MGFSHNFSNIGAKSFADLHIGFQDFVCFITETPYFIGSTARENPSTGRAKRLTERLSVAMKSEYRTEGAILEPPDQAFPE